MKQKIIQEYIPQKKYDLDVNELKTSFECINTNLKEEHNIQITKKMHEIKMLKQDNRLKANKIHDLDQ